VRGQNETIGVVAGLAQSVGASCSFENTSDIAAVLGSNGRTRKVILSPTTRDRNERHIATLHAASAPDFTDGRAVQAGQVAQARNQAH
jgi:hypothetical protein